MGKAFVIKGIDASNVALKKITLVSNMTEVTSELIIHRNFMFLNIDNVGDVNDDTLRPADGSSVFVLDVSGYRGRKMVLYTSSRVNTPNVYYRAFAKSFTSPITASDWSSVVNIVFNAIVPSDITPYIGGEHGSPVDMIWKEVEVPSDANYLLVTYTNYFASQIRVFVDPH